MSNRLQQIKLFHLFIIKQIRVTELYHRIVKGKVN
jgi:hypothetical protein